MYSTTIASAAGTTAALTDAQPGTIRRFLSRPGVLGGVGGLVFVATVLAQNAIRAGFPPNDASAQEVLTFYADHRGATSALAALFPIGLAGLVTFVGTLVTRAVRGRGRVAAVAGVVGSASLIGTFVMMVATELALSGYVHRGNADLSVVEGMWFMHNAVFGVLLAVLGVTFAGLSRAAVAHGIIGKPWRTAGLAGAGLLLIGAASTPAILDANPVMFVGVVGFLVWLAFVVRTSVAFLRGRAAD